MRKLVFHRSPVEIAEAIVLSREGLRRMMWVVYHGNHRVRIRPFKQGFQPTPWQCPKCRRNVGADDLKYDLATVRIRPRRALVDIYTVERDRGWNAAIDRVVKMLEGPPQLGAIREGIVALKREAKS